MSVFKPNFSNQSAYNGSQVLYFGFDGPYENYWTPAMVFSFYDPRGQSISSTYANIYIRMTGAFETSSVQNYDQVAGIFGNPSATPGTLGTTGQALQGSIQSIVNQVISGAASTAGFLASGGSTGRQQIEFLTREVFNSFQQLIYQGPGFRQFSPAFNMRPISEDQAETMREIIARLKIASSPDAGITTVAIDAPTGDEENLQFSGTLGTSTTGSGSAFNGTAFTFGYPHMCKIEVGLIKASRDLQLVRVFQSDYCMIQSVAATYGSQNKMSFFNGKAYPTEVSLQLQLREAVLQTRGNATREYLGGLSVL